MKKLIERVKSLVSTTEVELGRAYIHVGTGRLYIVDDTFVTSKLKCKGHPDIDDGAKLVLYYSVKTNRFYVRSKRDFLRKFRPHDGSEAPYGT